MNQRINNLTNTDVPNGVPCGLQLPVRLLKEPRHDTTETLVHRANLCLAKGEPALACALLRQLAWEYPDDAKVLGAFGKSLLALGRHRDAEICFQHLLVVFAGGPIPGPPRHPGIIFSSILGDVWSPFSEPWDSFSLLSGSLFSMCV